MDEFIGTVAACSTGRVGLIVRKETVTFRSGDTKEVYTGIGLDGKGLWASSDPIVIQPSIEEYMDRLQKILKEQPGAIYPPLGCGGINPKI